jgi:hypothetical protein
MLNVSNEKLGSGKFGVVYQGSFWGRNVAVKKIQIVMAEDEREVRAPCK